MKLKHFKLTRVARGKSQMQLQAETGICQVVVSRIERGVVKPTEEQKRLLSKALREPIKRLFPPKTKERKADTTSPGGDDVTILTGVAHVG